MIEEVFEENITEPIVNMEETAFQLKERAIKIAERKVNDCKKKFLAANVTDMDVTTYNLRLKEIRDKLEMYGNLVTDLVVDLDPDEATDQQIIGMLEQAKAKLLEEILTNETEVKEKVKQLLQAQPKTDDEAIELKKKQLERDEED